MLAVNLIWYLVGASHYGLSYCVSLVTTVASYAQCKVQ